MAQVLAEYHSGWEHPQVLVALHGVTDNGPALADIAEHFNDRMHVVLIDALGHGLSPRFTPEQLADPFAAMEQALVANLRQIVATKGPVVLLGHSMGGALAAVVAAKYPALVRALVLEDPAWLSEQAHRAFIDDGPSRVADLKQVGEQIAERVYRNRQEYPNWPVNEVGTWASSKTQVDLNFAAAAAVCPNTPWRQIAAQISVPTLVVTGDVERIIIGESGAEQIRELDNPKLRTVIIPGASHCVRRDQRQAFYRAVDEFLASLN